MKIANWWLQSDVFTKELDKQAKKLDKQIRKMNIQMAGGWAVPATVKDYSVQVQRGPTGIFSKLMDPRGVYHMVKGEYESWAGYMDQLPELTAQMFEDAVEHIKAHGWIQGEDVVSTGQVCAQGAFGLWTSHKLDGFKVNNYDSTRAEIFRARMEEIMDLMGIDPKFGSVVSWNDTDGRTKDEVIDALTLAAKKLRDDGR